MNIVPAGINVHISKMLKRLQTEKEEKEQEIQRLQDIDKLEKMTLAQIKSGTNKKYSFTIP